MQWERWEAIGLRSSLHGRRETESWWATQKFCNCTAPLVKNVQERPGTDLCPQDGREWRCNARAMFETSVQWKLRARTRSGGKSEQGAGNHFAYLFVQRVDWTGKSENRSKPSVAKYIQGVAKKVGTLTQFYNVHILFGLYRKDLIKEGILYPTTPHLWLA